MLQLPLFTAEALLRNYEWSKELLLQSWIDDPIQCCEKCGVSPPLSLLHERGLTSMNIVDLETISLANECGICYSVFELGCERIVISCDHQFCKQCWQNYLTVKIQEGSVHNIFCPAYDCFSFVPNEIIEKCVTKEMARRYLQFDIKAFVDSNPNFKWCPYPNCGLAVQSPLDRIQQSSHMKEFSKSVNCINGHYFCWDCLQEGHEPASCQNWKDWFDKLLEIKPEELKGTDEEEEIAANCLWLVTNSKKCPNCSISIQKNEGCNHIKCVKCKHDFCWICLEVWKKHSSTTGGYFQCNRYEHVNKIVAKERELITEAEQHHIRMVELNKFVHYYTRFKNHENSYRIEEPLSKIAKEKCEIILSLTPSHSSPSVTITTTENDQESQTKFIEDAIKELLRARRVLRCSYVYGYYLENSGHKKMIFEFIQTEFEECTETLSQIIARPYLRTPKARIIQIAKNVKRKRLEFLETIARGLIPPDTPPSLRKFSRQRWKYLLKDDVDGDDSELKKAIANSLKELNPKNPWVVDRKGRHTNLVTLLDEWPELEDEVDSCLISCDDGPYCKRHNCFRHRARNPTTSIIYDYCSLKCLRLDRIEQLEKEEKEMEQALLPTTVQSTTTENTQQNSLPSSPSSTVSSSELPPYQTSHYIMDLLRALEMSRLQAAREMEQNLYRPRSCSNQNVVDKSDYYDDLQRAIELSLKTNQQQQQLQTKQSETETAVASNSEIISTTVPSLLVGATVCFSAWIDDGSSVDEQHHQVTHPTTTFSSLDLFADDDSETLNSMILNMEVNDKNLNDKKVLAFDRKAKELKDNLNTPDVIKEYEDYDFKCMETSLLQQQIMFKRNSSNKKKDNSTIIQQQPPPPQQQQQSNDNDNKISVQPLRKKQQVQLKLNNYSMTNSNNDDIRPCEPGETFKRTSIVTDDQQQESQIINSISFVNPTSTHQITRAIVERIQTPTEDEPNASAI
ncbi:unnamed protein product [Didymodactylos carnosus]|nr:unnamed protein product [Didymodactylos carnosus]CAF3760448.1 unnamed protein product [Didymodactylos carnosus]